MPRRVASSWEDGEDMENAKITKPPFSSHLAPVYIHRIVRGYTLLDSKAFLCYFRSTLMCDACTPIEWPQMCERLRPVRVRCTYLVPSSDS